MYTRTVMFFVQRRELIDRLSLLFGWDVRERKLAQAEYHRKQHTLIGCSFEQLEQPGHKRSRCLHRRAESVGKLRYGFRIFTFWERH